MIRSALACVKPVVFALLAVVMLLSSAEVGLRLHEACRQGVSEPEADDSPLLMKSREMHHGLKPLRTVIVHHPDTNASVTLRVNSFGLRGREPTVPKPPEVYRILCLGDETTLAPEIPEPDTFCARLEELLQSRTPLRVEVVNAGVPGYCPLLSYLQMRRSLLALQPDLIVLNFHMSDVADDHRYRRHTRMSAGGKPLACPHPDFDRSEPHAPEGWMERFLVVQWYKQQLGRMIMGEGAARDTHDIDVPAGRYAWLKDDPPDWSIYIQQAFSPIEDLHQLCEGIYARLMVATSPVPWQVSATASNGPGARERVGVPENAVYRSRTPFRMLGDYLDPRGILFCDTSAAFQAAEEPDRLYLHNATRLSAAGHELYARELAAFVVQHVPGIWTGEPYNQPDRRAPELALPSVEERASRVE